MRARIGLTRLAAVTVCATLALIGLGTGSAAAQRHFDSYIAGNINKYNPEFQSPSSVAFDADGNAWITDEGHPLTGNAGADGLYKYSPYPSQTLLTVPETHDVWGGSFDLQGAVDQATGDPYVAQGNGLTISIFDPNGAFLRQWISFPGGGGFDTHLYVAVDNTHTYSGGRVYVGRIFPGDVEALDTEERPVDFPATANYITENRITGTPSGPFGEVRNVGVDSSGNIFVTDTGKHLVDEFDSTGTFVRALSVSVGGGVPGAGGVAGDPTNGDILITTSGGPVVEYDSSGNLVGTLTEDGEGPLQSEGTPGVNGEGYVYVPARRNCTFGCNGIVDIFTPNTVVPAVDYKPVTSPTTTSGTLNANVDPAGGGDVVACHFEYGTDTSYGASAPCSPDPSGGTSPRRPTSAPRSRG